METTMKMKTMNKKSTSEKVIKPYYVIRSKGPILAKKEYRNDESIPLVVYLYVSGIKNIKDGTFLYLLSLHFLDPETNTVKFVVEDYFEEINEHVVEVFCLPIMGIFPNDYEKEILKFDGTEMDIEKYQKIILEWKKSLE
jgi:hypothetical protein